MVQSGKWVASACLIIGEAKSYSLLGCTISNRPPVRLVIVRLYDYKSSRCTITNRAKKSVICIGA